MVFDTGAFEHGGDFFVEAALFGDGEEAVFGVVDGHGCLMMLRLFGVRPTVVEVVRKEEVGGARED